MQDCLNSNEELSGFVQRRPLQLAPAFALHRLGYLILRAVAPQPVPYDSRSDKYDRWSRSLLCRERTLRIRSQSESRVHTATDPSWNLPGATTQRNLSVEPSLLLLHQRDLDDWRWFPSRSTHVRFSPRRIPERLSSNSSGSSYTYHCDPYRRGCSNPTVFLPSEHASGPC